MCDSLFMDSDELELLNRYRSDNPSMFSFRDSDQRHRNVEESLAESEMERLLNQASSLLAARRSQLSKEIRNQAIQSRFTIPSVIEQRAIRNTIISSFDSIGTESPHAEFENLGHHLLKEVSLAQQPRNTPVDSISTLLDFYNKYVEEVGTRQLILSRRWFSLCTDSQFQLRYRKEYMDRQLQLSEEYSFCIEIQSRLDVLMASAEAGHSQFTETGVTIMHQQGSDELQPFEKNGRSVMSVESFDPKIYVSNLIYQHHIRRRFESFCIKSKLIPQYKRYVLFDKLVRYLLGGGDESNETKGDEADALPMMVVDDVSILSQVEELSTGFRLSGYDKSDLHEYLYHLNKRYTSTHDFQSEAWCFQPISVCIAKKGSVPDTDFQDSRQANQPVYLRPSPWSSSLFTSLFPRTQPDWEMEQIAAMQTVTTLNSRSVATSEADHLRIDFQLQSDFNFLSESDTQISLEEWRQRSQSHCSRAFVSVPLTEFDRVVHSSQVDQFSRKQTFEKDQTTQQRLQAVYQLRYLRTRQFRLQILKTLNYYASLLKEISRDCRGTSSVTNTVSGTACVVEGISCNFTEEMKRNALRPIVKSQATGQVADPDEFVSRLHSSLGLDPTNVTIDSVKGIFEDADSTSLPDPFWFADSYDAIDFSNSLQRSNVRDGSLGVLVMEEWAVAEMQRIEQRLLFTASFYLNKHLDHARSNSEKRKKQADDKAVDTTVMIEDIFECELWFQQSKLNMIDSLRECYQHATRRSDRSQIAKSMIELICSVPQLDLSDRHFVRSYTNLVVILDLKNSLCREIIQCQIEMERRVSSQVHSSLRKAPDGQLMFKTDGFGIPKAPSSDTALFKALFPKSSVISVFDIYDSLGAIWLVDKLVESSVESILGRFAGLQCSAATVFLQKEIIQEMLVQWRLLGDEEGIARKLHQRRRAQLNSRDPDGDSDAEFIETSSGTKLQSSDFYMGGLGSFAHVSEAISKISSEQNFLKGANPPPSPGEILENPSLFVPEMGGTDGTTNQQSQSIDKRRQYVSQEIQLWFDAMDAIRLQGCITSSLYETEIWCGVHRMQAQLMGINVRKLELDPIDFDSKRVFVENDELETVFLSSIESLDNDSPTSIFNLGSQLAIGEAVSANAEFLYNLSICEFERYMGDFTVQTFEGAEELIKLRLPDFRRAFYAQVTNKNVFVSVSLCNLASLDCYLEGLYRTHAEKIFQNVQSSFGFLGPSGTKALFEGSMRRDFAIVLAYPQNGNRRVRISGWPLLVRDEVPQNYFIDRRHLQRLFISVNKIKAVHRRCVLQELSHQATILLGTTKTGTVRKDMKLLKESLVDRYCQDISLSTAQYATKYQICYLGQKLRNQITEGMPPGSKPFFIFGSRNDQVRSGPRVQATPQEGKKGPTCLLTRNAQIDDCRYIPHFSQVIGLNFEVEPQIGTGSQNVFVDHFHQHGQTHFKQNLLLNSMASILHNWVGICQIVRGVASTQLSVQSLFTSSEKCSDVWQSELFRIFSDVESLRDPADLTSVQNYLHHRHSALYLGVVGALTSASYQAAYSQHENKSVFFEMNERLLATLLTIHDFRGFGYKHYFPRCEILNLTERISFLSNRKRVVPWFYNQCQKIVSFSSKPGISFDTQLQEVESSVEPASFNLKSWFLPFCSSKALLCHFHLQFSPPMVSSGELMAPYRCLDQYRFLCGASHEERLLFFTEFGKFMEMVEDCTEDAQESLTRVDDPNGTFITTVQSNVPTTGFSKIHYDVALFSCRRDQLRELYILLLKNISLSLPGELVYREPMPLSSCALTEDLYQRNIIHRSKIIYEKEMADPSGRGQRKSRCVERELRLRQCQLLIAEINKLIISRTCVELTSVVRILESESMSAQKGTLGSSQRKHNLKSNLFSEFCSILVARAHFSRGDTDRTVTIHIPEQSLNLAIETISSKLLLWETHTFTSILNSTETVLKSFTALVSKSISEKNEMSRKLQLIEKALPRRIQVGVAAENFDVLRLNAYLARENERLKTELRDNREKAREEVRLEFEDIITDLQARLRTRESQFASYKQKLFRDMQESLEDVRRSAMFSISSMEHAPVHVKRQALKIAISDDELNTLKQQNSELRQAIQKLKLWYELKLARVSATNEQYINSMKTNADNSQNSYWRDRNISEAEMISLKRDVSTLQVALTKSELEVEVLRKDLQSQLNNKKDLVAWKLQSGKQIEDLQKRIKKFEKLNAMYDLEKLVAEYEKRLSSPEHHSKDLVSNTQSFSKKILKGDALRASLSVGNQASSGAPSALLVPFEEYKKLYEQMNRERKLKQDAFARVETLRKGDEDANSSLVWQRRYLETAAELKNKIAENEGLKARIDNDFTCRK